MGFLDAIEKIEKKIKRLVSVNDERPEPLKINQLILNEIEDKVIPAGRSKRSFPYNQIKVYVIAKNEDHRLNLVSYFNGTEDLKDQVVKRLEQASCAAPGGLSVDIEILNEAGQQSENGFWIEYGTGKLRPQSPAQLVVLRGVATKRTMTLRKPIINIGRVEEVVDRTKQQIIRRNDLVFLDKGDEANHTVSRIHAHIEYDEGSGEYMLFDDRSEHGTRIHRAGQTINVIKGSVRGVKLRPGDEIALGQARVRFSNRK